MAESKFEWGRWVVGYVAVGVVLAILLDLDETAGLAAALAGAMAGGATLLWLPQVSRQLGLLQ